MGLPAVSVEEDPGGGRVCVLWGSPAASALLAARVGCEGHLHTHLAEGRTHTAAQDHGRKSPEFILYHFFFTQSFFSVSCLKNKTKKKQGKY